MKRRKFSFGKFAVCGSKRKINEVVLTVELRDWNGYPELVICGNVWNSRHTEVLWCGQIIEDLYKEYAELRASVLYRAVMYLWKQYHLKDISHISDEDKSLINLLFSDINDSEITKEIGRKSFYGAI